MFLPHLLFPIPLMLALLSPALQSLMVRQEPKTIITVTEEWQPSCLMAVPELSAIKDPDIFENAAFAWLAVHEEEIAHEIAQRYNMKLLHWRHDTSANDTPFGATIILKSAVRV